MKKKEDINDYCSAKDAAQILSEKHGRIIKPDYVSKMLKCKRYTIRSVPFGKRHRLYHKGDLAACTIKQKRSA
jgi:hypothetical protein